MIGGLIQRMFGGGDMNVSIDDLRKAIATGHSAIVDVRETGEFAAGHVPGAINVPLSRFDAALLPSGKPVILMCQAGGRSLRALGACGGRGDVRHFPGGMAGWRAAGGAVAT